MDNSSRNISANVLGAILSVLEQVLSASANTAANLPMWAVDAECVIIPYFLEKCYPHGYPQGEKALFRLTLG